MPSVRGTPAVAGLARRSELPARPTASTTQPEVRSGWTAQVGRTTPAEKLFGSLKGLPAVDRRQLEVIATGTNPLSRRAREHLAPLLSKPGFQDQAPEVRLRQVRAGFNKAMAEVAPGDAPELQKGRRTSPGRIGTSTIVKDFDFEIEGFRDKTPAKRTELHVNGRMVPVYSPPDGKFSTARGATELISHSLEDIARALSLLLPEDLARVKDVRLSPVPNPEDSMWAKLYKEKDFTSYMNAGPDGVITVFPWKPERSTDYSARGLGADMMHELGHVSSNGKWGPGRGAGRQREWTQWQDAMKADGVQVSVYARASIEEDLAETDALRKLANSGPYSAELRALLPHRMAMLDRHFPLKP
jgi:hypothetical protein